MKATYVNIGEPLQFVSFEKFKAPMGWIRIDILQRRINRDTEFKNKFSAKEIEIINKVVNENT